ncbi:serine--tRNA ligase [Lignipirellula cremea]|uniref:Serine--tRNA ligase n=1 Tax=Lignipirellula cremea TaxID=2528010 RepID=A0A518DYN9_9BACT|nr:serine--tRNA ligase [Lignipirellula cremea]QDU96962.1 Serine--tRNA ligase [Lignipirellula cremea]
MLDRKFIVENAAAVLENCRNRGVTVDVARLVELEAQRRVKLIESEDLNRQSNAKSKLIGQAKDSGERDSLKEAARLLREQKDAAQTEHDRLDREVHELQSAIPNMAHPDAPIGGDDQANLELRHGKHQPRKFDFKPLDHVELGEKHDLIDFEGGARTTGAGFYFLKNDAVLLELALQQFAVRMLVEEGFTPTITPDLARDSILEGIGFSPRGPETQIYSIEQTDLSLVGTAEITLGGLYSGHTFNAEELPLKLCGISHCYRTEAGAAGRASRGLYRVHQFTKIEMFAFSLPEQSEGILDKFCELEGRIFDALEIPYRVVDTATGDLGGPAYRKFDLEAWMPGRGDGGEYGEVTSTSNCTDYQSRRLNIRYKNKGEKGSHFVHTLNGTAIAISRGMIAVLENHQNADGTITVPEVLRPYVGKDKIG